MNLQTEWTYRQAKNIFGLEFDLHKKGLKTSAMSCTIHTYAYHSILAKTGGGESILTCSNRPVCRNDIMLEGHMGVKDDFAKKISG